VEAHAKKDSKTYKQCYGIWVDNTEAMNLKTPLKLLLSKYAPMSIEIQNAIKYDQAVIKDENENLEYPDNEPIPTENAEKFKEGMKEKFAQGLQTEIPATEFEEIKKEK
jgi:recombination protein RecT